MSVSLQLRRADALRVRVNGTGIETDGCKETLQRRVAVTEAVFAIESGADFVDQIVADHADIGTRIGIVADVVLCKTQPSERRYHR